jgi:hypothetical protein
MAALPVYDDFKMATEKIRAFSINTAMPELPMLPLTPGIK